MSGPLKYFASGLAGTLGVGVGCASFAVAWQAVSKSGYVPPLIKVSTRSTRVVSLPTISYKEHRDVETGILEYELDTPSISHRWTTGKPVVTTSYVSCQNPNIETDE